MYLARKRHAEAHAHAADEVLLLIAVVEHGVHHAHRGLSGEDVQPQLEGHPGAAAVAAAVMAARQAHDAALHALALQHDLLDSSVIPLGAGEHIVAAGGHGLFAEHFQLAGDLLAAAGEADGRVLALRQSPQVAAIADAQALFDALYLQAGRAGSIFRHLVAHGAAFNGMIEAGGVQRPLH